MPGGRRVPEAAFAPAAPAWPVCAVLRWPLSVPRPSMLPVSSPPGEGTPTSAAGSSP